MNLQIEKIVEAVGGVCLNDTAFGNNCINNICIDSRKVEENTLFIPIKGENFDGHRFISTVFEKGAIATFTHEKKVVDNRLITIYVEDTKEALLMLAAYYRSLFPIPVVAVTGSVGKTSTKDLIAATLSGKFKVHKTEGNFNNDIGLPLTLFNLEEQHEVSVVEMGMNHFNEIHVLSMTAKPDVAVITNIGVSHIENLGSREGILKAKLEILDGLKENGLLIVNGEDTYLQSIKDSKVSPIRYGRDEKSTYYATDLKLEENHIEVCITTPKETYPLMIPTIGEHMVDNTLAAVAVAEYLGLSKEEIQKGLESYTPSKMRMHKFKTDSGLTIIDDTYNASPDSMRAALKVLKDTPTTGKRIAVLGDMFEMGEHAPKLHQEVGVFVGEYGVDILCTIGELASYMAEGIKRSDAVLLAKHYKTHQEFLEAIDHIASAGDTLLFKASRGMHFEKLVDAMGKVKLNEN